MNVCSAVQCIEALKTPCWTLKVGISTAEHSSNSDILFCNMIKTVFIIVM